MFRQVVPFAARAARICPARQYCSRSRWMPVARPRFFDEFMPSPLSRMMDNQARMAWKMMEDMTRPGFFWEGFQPRTRVAKEGCQVKYTSQTFEVRLDVQNFEPEELHVKMTSDHQLVVSAKHQEKQDDHGFISREFTRQITVPEDVDLESFESQLTTDGVLVIKGKVKGAEDVTERVINITREQPKQDGDKDGGTTPPAS